MLFFIIFFNPLMRIFELDIVLGVKSLILFILPSSINLIFGQIETFMNVLKYENVLYKSSMISFPLIICTMVVGTYFRSIDSVLISLIIGSIILNIVNIFFFIKTYKTAFNWSYFIFYYFTFQPFYCQLFLLTIQTVFLVLHF